MAEQTIGPERRHVLEVYCKCLRRAERRIIIAGQIVNGRPVDLTRFQVQGSLIRHAVDCIRKRGIMGHGSALIKLQIARSRYSVELAGLPW